MLNTLILTLASRCKDKHHCPLDVIHQYSILNSGIFIPVSIPVSIHTEKMNKKKFLLLNVLQNMNHSSLIQ